MGNWTDSHCHLQRFEQEGELPAVLGRAESAGVGRMIAVGTSLEDWVPYRELAQGHPGRIDYTAGLHPGHVDADWEDGVRQLSAFFMPPQAPVALGEIGLDFFHLPKDPVAAGDAILHQEAAFRQQLLLAGELGCPVVVHSRKAFAETVRLIDASGIDWTKVVFHCFSYGPEEVRQLNERGGRASFTGIVTYKNAPEVREALRVQGVESLMLETDSPYLAPEPHRGQSNEPAYVADIGRRCAEVLAVSVEELAERTTANVKEFFGL
ncbi:MAG: TatD family hydrolase [Verrucomicrobiota bacterium]